MSLIIFSNIDDNWNKNELGIVGVINYNPSEQFIQTLAGYTNEQRKDLIYVQGHEDTLALLTSYRLELNYRGELFGARILHHKNTGSNEIPDLFFLLKVREA